MNNPTEKSPAAYYIDPQAAGLDLLNQQLATPGLRPTEIVSTGPSVDYTPPSRRPKNPAPPTADPRHP